MNEIESRVRQMLNLNNNWKNSSALAENSENVDAARQSAIPVAYQSTVVSESENSADAAQKEKTNPLNFFQKRDGSLVNPYLDYEKIMSDSSVNIKTKDLITEATGITASNQEKNDGAQATGTIGTSGGKLGFVSAKYESGGWNPGTISSGSGDYGGVSYGIPQFSTTTGSAASFVKWLKSTNPEIGAYFGEATPGTDAFNSAWTEVANKYGDSFGNLQTQYAYNNMVQPLITLAKQKTGVDYSRSAALRELVYSTAIQFGGGSLGLSALGDVTADMSDTDIINASYDKKIANYKSFFRSSSAAVQESVKNRFANERNDVLALVGTSSSNVKTSGGYTAGKRIANTASYNNDAAKGQCIWYVRGRMKEKLGKDTGAIGNANEMYYNAPAKAKVTAAAENLKPNMVVSYKYGSSSAGQAYGHVIYIEDVVGDTVYYTEGGSSYYKNGTDGVVKTASRQQVMNGVNSSGARIGSQVLGLIDVTAL